MRRTWTVLLLAILASSLATAGAHAARVVDFSIGVNTINKAEVWFSFKLSQAIDDERTIDGLLSESIALRLSRVRDDSVLGGCTIPDDDCVAVGGPDSTISFTLPVPSMDMVRRIYRSEEAVYLTCDPAITVFLADGTDFNLTADDMKHFSEGAVRLNDRQLEMLVQAEQGYQLPYETRFDVLREINEDDTTIAEYAMAFDYPRTLGFFRTVARARGRVSTRRQDPLNRLEFSIGTRSGQQRLFDGPFQMIGNLSFDLAVVGTQSLDTSSAKVRLAAEGLLPNLVDLTAGANRLRLKPFVKIGVAYVRHLQNQGRYGGEDWSLEAFAEGYYYVPLLDKFALIYEAEASIDNELKDIRGWLTRQSVTVVYDLPLPDLKTLFKWESGQNEFTTVQDSRVLIGVLLDYVSL